MSSGFETDLSRLLRETAHAVPTPDPVDSALAVVRRARRIRHRRAATAIAASAGAVAVAVTVAVLATTVITGLPRPPADRVVGPDAGPGRTCLTQREAEELARRTLPEPTPGAGVWQVVQQGTATRVSYRGRTVALLEGRVHPEWSDTRAEHLALVTDPAPLRASGTRSLQVVDATGGVRDLVGSLTFGATVVPSPEGSAVAYYDGVGSGPVNAIRIYDLATGRETARLAGQYGPDTTYRVATWAAQGLVISGPAGLVTWQPGSEPQAREGLVSEVDGTSAVMREGSCYWVTDAFALPLRGQGVPAPPSIDPSTLRAVALDAEAAELVRNLPLPGADVVGWVRAPAAKVLAAYYPRGQRYLGGQLIPGDHDIVVIKAHGRFEHHAPSGASRSANLSVSLFDLTTHALLPMTELWTGDAADLGVGTGETRWDLRLVGTPRYGPV